MKELIIEALESLSIIEEDNTVPKNIRIKIKSTISILQQDNCDASIKIDRSLQELSEVADDPNISAYTRMQIWSVVSQLESNEQ